MKLLDLFRRRPAPARLNCRPGDLARIIDQGANQDRFVSVIELADDAPGWWCVEPLQRVWDYRRGCFVPAGTPGRCSDARLMPIRDGNGEDETLRWAGKPRERGVTVYRIDGSTERVR